MATSFSGGRCRKEPPTTGKQLVNFITCEAEILLKVVLNTKNQSINMFKHNSLK
jgi:hypothetical protein